MTFDFVSYCQYETVWLYMENFDVLLKQMKTISTKGPVSRRPHRELAAKECTPETTKAGAFSLHVGLNKLTCCA